MVDSSSPDSAATLARRLRMRHPLCASALGRLLRIAPLLVAAPRPLHVLARVLALAHLSRRGRGADEAAADVRVERLAADVQQLRRLVRGDPCVARHDGRTVTSTG